MQRFATSLLGCLVYLVQVASAMEQLPPPAPTNTPVTSPPTSPRQLAAPPPYVAINLPELPPIYGSWGSDDQDQDEPHDIYYQIGSPSDETPYAPLLNASHTGSVSCTLLRFAHLVAAMNRAAFFEPPEGSPDELLSMEDIVERMQAVPDVNPLTPFFIYANAGLPRACLPPEGAGSSAYAMNELDASFVPPTSSETFFMAVQLFRGTPLLPFLRQVQQQLQHFGNIKLRLLVCAGVASTEEHDDLRTLLSSILAPDAPVYFVHPTRDGQETDWINAVLFNLRQEGHAVHTFLLGRTDMDPNLMQRIFYDLDPRLPCNKALAQRFEERLDVRNASFNTQMARLLAIYGFIICWYGPYAGICYALFGNTIGFTIFLVGAGLTGGCLAYCLKEYGWPLLCAYYLRRYRYH